MTRRVVLGLAAGLLVVAGGLPLLAMLSRALVAGGRLDHGPLVAVLASPRPWRLLARSVLLGSLVTVAACGAGIPLGVLLGRTDLPLRRTLGFLFTAPLLVPPWVLAVAWSDLLGGRLRGLGGCVLVLGIAYLPVPLLLTVGALATVDPRLEEAARLAAGWPRVLRSISLPLALPGILLSAVLVFLLAVGEFTVPGFFRWDVYAVETLARFAAFHDVRGATVAALPLAAAALFVLPLESALLRGRTDRLLPHPETRRPAAALGRWRPAVAAGVAGAAGVLVLLPLAALLARAAGEGALGEALARAGSSLPRTLAWSALGATLLAGTGFLLGLAVHERALPGWRGIDALALFLFALPGAVTGIGLAVLWNRPATAFLYGTPLVVLLGWLARYAVLASRITVAQLAQVPPSMGEAARVAGAGWGRRTLAITVPLARRGLLLAWVVGYVFCARDTAIAMLVYPPGRDTLPVRTLTLMANGSPGLVAGLCLLAVAITLGPAALLLPALRRAGGRTAR